MRGVVVFLLGLCLALTTLEAKPSNDHFLGSYMSRGKVNKILKHRPWEPYPQCSNREFWEGLPPYIKAKLLEEGVSRLDYEPSHLTASKFLDVFRTGDRQTYQAFQRARRNVMTAYMLAECVEDKGRFVPKIADLLWMIAEQSFWGSPSHLFGTPSARKYRDKKKSLPNIQKPILDIFAADTAKDLAWVLYFLGDKIDGVSKDIRPRIEHEIKMRILEPGRLRDDFLWMGLADKRRLNNWASWILKNWLTVLLLTNDDYEHRKESFKKIIFLLDKYYAGIPLDGSSDEGPTYWGAGMGRYFEILEMLAPLYGKGFDVYEQEKVRNMLQFAYKLHIEGHYVVSLSDSTAFMESPNPYMINLMARRIGDPKMLYLAAQFSPQWKSELLPVFKFDWLRLRFYEIFEREGMENLPKKFNSPQHIWLPNLQYMLARSASHSNKGLILVGKAGSNNESHNHNDVGVMMAYLNGKPLIADAGKRTYTHGFKGGRYHVSNWNHVSGYHNLPIINGVMQKNGAQYRASNVHYERGERGASLSFEIQNAYPKKAKLEKWQRKIEMLAGLGDIVLSENYVLAASEKPLRIGFLTPARVGLGYKKGVIRLIDAEGVPAYFFYDAEGFSVHLEEMEVEGDLAKSWKGLTQIWFTQKQKPALRGGWKFRISLKRP